MENLLIIKTLFNKLYIHPLFYLFIIIFFITGHFRNIFYFTFLILIHELGHTIMAIIFKIKLNRIELYPFGGHTSLNYLININIYKELLILLFGPFIQLITTYLIYYLNINVSYYFYTYSKFILLFNLLPIYPLDGGKIINIILSYFISFYNSLKYTYYISYITINIVFFYILIFNRNLLLFLIFITVSIELYKSFKNRYYILNRFYIERILYSFSFKKTKIITNILSMKRDYYHFFKFNNRLLNEKEYAKINKKLKNVM